MRVVIKRDSEDKSTTKWLFGMMPASEVEKAVDYKDQHGLNISIRAGKTGYFIMWADHSSTSLQVTDTTENNFEKAYDYVTGKGFVLTPVSSATES